MKIFNPKSLAAKAVKANKKSKLNIQRRKFVEKFAKVNGYDYERADIELWLQDK